MNEKIKYSSILELFDQKCKKLNIWYSLSNSSLLNAVTNNKFLNDNPIIEIMMTVENYNKFLQNYHQNIVDNLTINDFYYTNPFYFENDKSNLIKINLLIKANVKKTEKFYSRKNLLRQKIGYYRSKKRASNFADFFKKMFYSFCDLFLSPLTWYEINSNISDSNTNFNGFFVVDSFKENINKNWIPSLTYDLEEIKWNGINTYIIKEWEVVLNKRYGLDWRKDPIIEKDIDFSFIYENFC